MKCSPSPVAETAQCSEAQVTAPMRGLSPTQPGNLAVTPPVEVAAAKPAVVADGDGADRALTVGIFQRGEAASALAAQLLLQGPPAPFRLEILIVLEHDFLAAQKFKRARADHHHVGRMIHHRAGRHDRVARAANSRHRTRLLGPAIHNGRVHLFDARPR